MDYDENDSSVAHYNDSNRAFLQGFLARGTLTVDEGKKLLAAIFTVAEGRETNPDEITQEDVDSYISAAADAISPFDYEIRSTQHQISKKRLYALVNSNSDMLTQLATICTPEEIAYIKRFLDGMFDTFNRRSKEVMAVSGMQAMQGSFRKGAGRQSVGEGSQFVDKGVTQEQVEKLLGHLVTEGWLERSQAGYYTLAPRALMELRSWLVETYNDSDEPEDWQRIKFCEACREIVTIGQRCTNIECNVRLHNVCETAYWNSRPAKKCPKCHAPWAGNKFVGEKAVTTTEDYLKGKRRSGGHKRSRNDNEDQEEDVEEEQSVRRIRQRNATQAESEEDEAEEEEEELPTSSRRNQRRRGAPNSGVDEDDDEDEE